MNGLNRIALFGVIVVLALIVGCSGEKTEETAPLQETVSNVGILAERLAQSIADAEALQAEMIDKRASLGKSLGALEAKVGEAERELQALEASIDASAAALGKLRGDLDELLKITAGPEAAEAVAAPEAESESGGAAKALGIALAVLIIAGVFYAVIMIRNRLEESDPGSRGASITIAWKGKYWMKVATPYGSLLTGVGASRLGVVCSSEWELEQASVPVSGMGGERSRSRIEEPLDFDT